MTATPVTTATALLDRCVAAEQECERLRAELARVTSDARTTFLCNAVAAVACERVVDHNERAIRAAEALAVEVERLRDELAAERTERDTARRDLDAVRRVLADGLGADARESDLDALALAARACETIDCLRAQVTSITTAVDALTSTERDDDRADAAQMRAGWRALSAERDALARGESAPSLDAIRAWEAHGGVWLCVRTPHLRGATVGLRAGLAGGVVVLDGDIGCSYDDHAEFAWHHEGARFWRVADDGSLAEASS